MISQEYRSFTASYQILYSNTCFPVKLTSQDIIGVKRKTREGCIFSYLLNCRTQPNKSLGKGNRLGNVESSRGVGLGYISVPFVNRFDK